MSLVVALVQARMGSTRFPGKMLAELGGYPILEWVLKRISRARLIDRVVLATTTSSRDDALVSLAQKLGVEVFRGSETDVLGRFAAAAAQHGADVVVRVCADNPFVDPDEVDRLVNHFNHNLCDYACNHQDRLGSLYADGFGAEILSSALLQQIANTALDTRHREHATLYIWDHASDYRLSTVSAPSELAHPELRFDVDQPHDLTYLQALANAGVNIGNTASEIVRIALSRDHVTLVTTDIQLESPTDFDNAFFLGAWCFSTRHNENIARRAGRIIDYHWNDRNKLKRDYERLELLNEEILEDLSIILNQIHGINENKRFWRLLLGYWLNIYTTVVFDRWSSLEQARRIGQSWQTEVRPVDDDTLAANDTAEFVQIATESSQWNHSLFALLIQYIPGIKSIPVKIELSASAASMVPETNSNFSKRLVKDVVRSSANLLKSRDRFFLIGTYLSIEKLVKLEMALGQFPLPRLQFEGKINTGFDVNWRQWMIPLDSAKDEYSLIVRKILPKFLPRIFLEGFRELMLQANKLPWPKSPKVIFTSNQHFASDVFKAWAAQKMASGARLVIGEHGGLGTGLFNGAHRYEVSVADVYLSTGWNDLKYKNIIPVGLFKSKSSNLKPNPAGKALLVCGIMPRFSFDIRAMMLSSQVLDYFDDQFRFIEALPKKIREEIIVRLYPSDYGWEQRDRWLDRHPAITFDDGRRSMMKAASQCRLFIGTYNCTTYIESLVLNFPTVMFWNPLHWEIKPEAQSYFDKLRNVGIFHESAASAALHISGIWDDIPSWWKSEAVQSARRYFCDNYAASPPDIIGRLKQILLDEADRSMNRS